MTLPSPKRTFLLLPFLTFLLFVPIFETPSAAADQTVEVAAGNSVMQCMANCIRHEGNTASAKDICKLRCANVANPTQSGRKKDCMGTHKACNRACGKSDKACQRSCEKNLMKCG